MITWWVRNDQRLSDNICWDTARSLADSLGQELHAVYAWNEMDGALGLGGIPRMSPRRIEWTRLGLAALRSGLANHQVPLHETSGSVTEWLRSNRPHTLVFSRGAAVDERNQELAVQKLGITIRAFWTHTLVTPSGIPGGIERLPATFTPFRHQVERDSLTFNLNELQTVPHEQSPTSPNEAFPYEPGESAGLARLESYMSNPKGAATYKTQRNGLLGTDFSTKFSPWLASGALSPQRIWQSCLDLEDRLGGSPDVAWIRVELLWREYFQWVAFKSGTTLFQKRGFRDVPPKNGFNAKAFQRWVDGATGDDFVDAGMIELAQTGFSSNRARQNMASYLIHDMGLDWRYGAAYFESQLIDYDPASNWANWAYIAGVGNDPRPVRRFNTAKQASDYDADGTFRAHWLRRS
jgi:deoxyribodipyrimidine photo-lyase